MMLHNYKRILQFCLIISLLAAVVSNTTHAQSITYYVDSATGNDAHTGTSWGTAYRNVTRAIAAANASTMQEVDIWISKGTYTPVEGIIGLPADVRDTSFTFYRGNGVGKALKIYGGFAGSEASIAMRDTLHHTILDGRVGVGLKSYHVIVIAGLAPTADSLVLDGLTISNGFASDSLSKNYNGVMVNRTYGGGISICNDSSLNSAIRSCLVVSDSAIGALQDHGFGFLNGVACYGGGLYNYRSSPFFIGCRFSGNTVEGGNPDAAFYGEYVTGGNGYGGAICNVFSSSQFLKCSFNTNVNIGGGEPGYSAQGGSALGGSVSNIASHCSFAGCVFNANTAIGGGSDGDIIGWTAGAGKGGAVYDSASVTVFRHCNFDSNSVLSITSYIPRTSYGGAVYNVSGSNSVLDTCSFVANVAKNEYYASGGALYNDSSSAVLTGCAFIADSARAAYARGGAVGEAHSSSVYTNCNFDSNVVNIFYGATDTCRGGAVYNYFSSPLFRNCNFRANYACNTDGDGAQGGAVYNFFSSPQFGMCDFIANYDSATYMQSWGGAMFNTHSSPVIDSCRFLANRSYGEYGSFGGAIYNGLFSEPEVKGCTFSQNSTSAHVSGGGTYGGAIYQADSRLHIAHCIFTEDSSSSGGAIYLGMVYGAVGAYVPTGLRAENSIFWGNRSRYGGAAIYFNETGGADTLINNLLIRNKDWGTSGGGAIFSAGDAHFIANNTFYNDTAAATGHGGAIEFEGTTGHYAIVNNIFSGNRGQATSSDTSIATGSTYYFSHNLFGAIDPLFVDPTNPIGADLVWGTADDGLHLQNCSPGRNTGLDSFVLVGEAEDIAYAERIEAGIVDIGAYETNALTPVNGAHDICVGGSLVLTDTSSGGSWITVNAAIATVNVSGIVTGLSSGVDTIMYILTGGCSTDTAFTVVSVFPPAEAGAILGPDHVCAGAGITLTDSITGGTWTMSNGNATVSEGVVMGVIAGMDTVTYTNSCGMGHAEIVITIYPIPDAGNIIGTDSLCVGTVTTLTDAIPGGVWSVSNTNLLVSEGVITAITSGIATVYYTVSSTSGCVDSATMTVHVIALPDAGIVIGMDSICIGVTTTYSETVSGGVWTATNPAIAAISAGGSVTGVSPGMDTIIYSYSNYCGTAIETKVLTVDRAASAIVGFDTLCIGATTMLSDSSSGGVWSSSDVTTAIIDSAGLVHGIAQGVDLINYILSNACGTSSVSKLLFVERPASPIVSSDTICVGNVIPLQDSTLLGVWSSSDTAVALVIAPFVYGMAPGECTITYAVNNLCGSSMVTQNLTVLSIDVCDSLAGVVNVEDAREINVFPNPAKQRVHISSLSPVNIIMMTIEGRRIKVSSNAREIDLSDVANGVYILIISDSEGRTLKIERLIVDY